MASFFPEQIGILGGILILVTSFVASVVTAALSIGGGLLLIAVMSAVLPGAAIIPVHGAVMAGSNAGRVVVLFSHTDWRLVFGFLAGALLGTAIGFAVVTEVPVDTLRLMIGGFILFSQWGPALPLPKGRFSIGIAGAFSMVLTLFVGASGPFITALLAQMPHYVRQTLVATAGACMTIQHTFKVGIFAVLGFAFAPWLPLIVAAIVVGFIGTWVGAKLLHRLPEAMFRQGLKWLLTGLAGYLVISGLAGVVG